VAHRRAAIADTTVAASRAEPVYGRAHDRDGDPLACTLFARAGRLIFPGRMERWLKGLAGVAGG